MKKLISLLLVLTMVAAMAAGCANEKPDTTEPQAQLPGSALEILENTWAAFGENEMFFAMGGDYNNPVDNAPGAVDVTNSDYLTGVLLVPETEVSKVTEAASLMHGMMANNFTCGAFRVEDAQAFAEAMHTAIANNPWICGMPESMLIVTFGDAYVVAAFGVNDAITPFQTHLTEAYPDANIVYSEAITD